MYYFAYGSNMLTARLARRVPSLQPAGPAWLPAHRLSFAMRGGDGSGKCNVAVAGADDGVYGVLYALGAKRLERLHAAEGPGYEFVELDVQSGALGAVPAAVYRGRAAWLGEGLMPYIWYLRFVVEGAREHGLPVAHVRELGREKAKRDPNLWRAWCNWRIYKHRPKNVCTKLE